MRSSTVIAWSSAAALSLGCHTYSHVATSQDAVTRAGAGSIEVTRNDHSVIRLKQASVVGDSIVAVTDDRAGNRIALATRDVQRVSVRQLNVGRSVALGAGVAIAAFAALLTAAASLLPPGY